MDYELVMPTTPGQIGGGAVIILTLLAGIAGVLVLLERFYVIVVRSKNNGRPFIERIIQLVRGDKIEEAIKQCTASKALLPDMGLLILRSRSRDEADLENIASAAALSVLPRLTRRLQYLPTLALTAVLLGVLGSVREFQAALAAAAEMPPSPRAPLALLTQLSNAFTPIAVGLVIAIVLILGRSYLVSQAESITEQVREFSARLINALIDRPDVRLGHR